ncbi:hypothetical protein EVAR_62912_1 [Eumeta japonica]|uniref:Uncharacterized protein n=1 Tax=Eumeta variegata TaxID=151549 RepID=A0A4C1Y6Y4_EUMVA|nr:hypothetical protein EVAR_62912_1 [Eumeta japonica]
MHTFKRKTRSKLEIHFESAYNAVWRSEKLIYNYLYSFSDERRIRLYTQKAARFSRTHPSGARRPVSTRQRASSLTDDGECIMRAPPKDEPREITRSRFDLFFSGTATSMTLISLAKLF